MTDSFKELFQKWQELNVKVGESFGNYDFDSIKKVREEMSKIEDKIYIILLENALDELRKILPDDCGEMEIGFDIKNKLFYFLMEDPEQDDSDELKVLAITIDINKNVKTIKDFKDDESGA